MYNNKSYNNIENKQSNNTKKSRNVIAELLQSSFCYF